MPITLIIDGREAVLVRALPFVGPRLLYPERIALDLSLSCYHAEFGVISGLKSYRRNESGEVVQFAHIEWDRICSAIRALPFALDAQVGARPAHGDHPLRDVIYDRAAIPLLPAGVFVWRDELEAAYRQGVSVATEARPGDLDLVWEPHVAPDLCALVWEGREALERVEHGAAAVPAPPTVAAPETPTAAAPETPTATASLPDTAGMVAWQAVVIESWPAILEAHGPRPRARRVMEWLKKHAPRDVVPVEQPDRNSLKWTDTGARSHTLEIKTISNQLWIWRKDGRI